jgi:Fe2+ transport system protein FeoA
MTPHKSHRVHDTVSLAALAGGSCATFVTLDAGAGLRTRLVAMGMRPGARLRVIHNGGRGPFVVAVEDARIVLGRGMAHRILVTPLEAAAPDRR